LTTAGLTTAGTARLDRKSTAEKNTRIVTVLTELGGQSWDSNVVCRPAGSALNHGSQLGNGSIPRSGWRLRNDLERRWQL